MWGRDFCLALAVALMVHLSCTTHHNIVPAHPLLNANTLLGPGSQEQFGALLHCCPLEDGIDKGSVADPDGLKSPRANMSDPKAYTVGWICAITTECVAAQAFLDEVHDSPAYLSPHDDNDYALGKFGKHNTAIAVLPTGEYGTTSAAGVARDMLRSFPNARFGLMVGIGGGVPSQHDTRLGDVVVSAPQSNIGGVFQYDFGNAMQDQSFQPTGFLNQPPTILRTAMHGLKSRYETDGHQIIQNINDAIEKRPRLKRKYSKPDPQTDRLYRSDYIHVLGNSDDCAATCGCDADNLILRTARSEDKDDPAIHYGIVASANKLMKDAILRDKLATEKDVLCFEWKQQA